MYDDVLTYLPDNLDLSAIVPAKWRDYAAWVVGGLYLRRHTEKYAEADDFRRVSSDVLKKVLPKRDYKDILDALVENGVVERCGYQASQPGRRGKCRGFRLTPRYREAQFRRVRLTHAELVRKVARLRRREKSHSAAEVHDHLEAVLARLEVTPDAPDVLPLARIRDREFSFKVCRYGRVHTNLTNLSGALRSYLRVDGKPLWGIDVVNSQPLLLGLTLVGQEGPMTKEITAYREWLSHQSTTPPPSSYPYPNPSSSPFTTPNPYLGTLSGSCQDDLSEYVELCLNGSIYERLMSLTGLDRAAVKKEFFHVAYGRPRFGGSTDVGKAFRAAFPSCWEGVCRLKEGGHEELARRMQVVESYVVVWRACRRLMAGYPDAPLLTLHDSVVTDEEHVGAVEKVLVGEYRAVFGVEPRVKAKPFLPGPEASLAA